jgi:thiosulfate/3-mercaptopyruvate sulfurtransferase
LRHPDYLPIGPIELQNLLSKSGVTSDMTVVFYGYGAHLGFWLLSSHGHGKARLMDGSREQWIAAGGRWSTDSPTPTRVQYELAPQNAYFSSKEDVRGTIGRPGSAIIDTRSKAEYDGERFWPSGAAESAGRTGHIPGAVHIPAEFLRTDNGMFRGEDEMRQVMRVRRVAPETEIVTYCTIGNRAAQAWFALKYLLGYRDVRVYYGSWTEWEKSAEAFVARLVVIVRNACLERRAARLQRERDNRRIAADRSAAGAALEVVGHNDARTARLIEMHMAVDSAGQHEPAGGVDLGTSALDRLGQLHDDAILDADITSGDVGGGHHGATANGEIERHGRLLAFRAAFGQSTWSSLAMSRSTSSIVL